jgi:5-methylcytosine-specific restriction protein A
MAHALSDAPGGQSLSDQSESLQQSPIEIARAYVNSRVQAPALASELSTDIKNKVRHANLWLTKFRRVGDLLAYLKRFEVDKTDAVYMAMKECGLLTFEDIVFEFEKRFEAYANDCSRITDFIVGVEYSAFDILILARNYDTRAGGMFVLDANEIPFAVVIKANLADGKYPNQWLDEPTRLKYYLKSIRKKDTDIFGEHFKANKAILDAPTIPIITFTRTSLSAPFVYRGVFKFADILREDSGAKAFVLERQAAGAVEIVADAKYVATALSEAVVKSASSQREARLVRLAAAPKVPTSIKVVSTAYVRNADVIVEVLFRASGRCESCTNTAPFIRAKDGTPYLEVHHRVPLSENGEDTVSNAIALCPNCHREWHFGLKKIDYSKDPIAVLSVNLSDAI